MSARELLVLGTSSQVPTRHRNHNGYFLRWDAEGILFDPGEGTQRQMTTFGLKTSAVTRVCITHFHGDHCLGFPGIVQRASLDGVVHPIEVVYPASGQAYLDRLRHASIFVDQTHLVLRPLAGEAQGVEGPGYTLTGRRLEHSTECYGFRVKEPDSRRMLSERLAEAGVVGPNVGRLLREGRIDIEGRTVTLEEMSAPRPGQSFAFLMDTRLCDACFQLASGVDMLVCESTFLESEKEEARAYGHMTASEAARIAREAGARRLVLTHFSQRYGDVRAFYDEACRHFDDVVVATDGLLVPVPPRRIVSPEG